MLDVVPRIVWTAIDVAERLNRSTDLVQKLTRTGRLLPIAVTPRGVKLYDPSDVERFIRTKRSAA